MRAQPLRTCIACRSTRDKRTLTRIVRGVDGIVHVDPTGRLSGRGAYVCDEPACRAAAVDRGMLTRALGMPLTDEVRRQLIGDHPDAPATVGPSFASGGIRGQE